MNKKFKLDIDYVNEKDIKDIFNFASANMDSEVTIYIKSTKSLSSKMLKSLLELKNVFFRVAGVYTEDYIKRYNNENYLLSLNIYTVIELFHIIKKMEQLETCLLPDYSATAKAYVIYNSLRFTLRYDKAAAGDLRALLNGFANSLAMSVVLQEMLSRNNVLSEIVISKNFDQTWIYFINSDKKFALDLSLDAYYFSINTYAQLSYFANYDKDDFARLHPLHQNETITYDDFSIITAEELENLEILTSKEIFSKNLYHYTRKDQSKFALSLLSSHKKFKYELYKYIYCDIDNGRSSGVQIFYSENDFFAIRESQRYLKEQLDYINNEDKEGRFTQLANDIYNTLKLASKDQEYLKEKFLSKERLDEEKAKSNAYFGSYYLINGQIQLAKDKNVISENIVIRHYRRMDGSNFALEKIEGDIFTYNYYHIDIEENQSRIYKTKLYSDTDIFNGSMQLQSYIVNKFLSIKRIENRSKYFGGYLSKVNEIEAQKFNEEIKVN